MWLPMRPLEIYGKRGGESKKSSGAAQNTSGESSTSAKKILKGNCIFAGVCCASKKKKKETINWEMKKVREAAKAQNGSRRDWNDGRVLWGVVFTISFPKSPNKKNKKKKKKNSFLARFEV